MRSNIDCFQYKLRAENNVRKLYFKVLTRDMKSLGLLGATSIEYRIGKWVRPLEPISDHPRKGGGLWVVGRLCDARGVQRSTFRDRKMKTRIFECRIGHIIKLNYEAYGLRPCPHSKRVKTDGVMLLREVK